MNVQTDRETMIREGDEEAIRQQEQQRKKKVEPDPIKEAVDDWIKKKMTKSKPVSMEDLRKALEQKAKTMSSITDEVDGLKASYVNPVTRCSILDSKWIRLEDVEAFLVELFKEKVIVSRKQLSKLLENVPSHVKWQDCPPCSAWMVWSEKVKELLEAGLENPPHEKETAK